MTSPDGTEESLLTRIGLLLFHPGTFFSGVELEGEDMVLPVSIVATAALLSILGNFLSLLPDLLGEERIPGYSHFLAAYSMIFYGIFLVIGTFLFWFILSSLFYAFSRLLSGTGSLRGTMQAVGYGLLPWALSRLLTLPGQIFDYRPWGLLDLMVVDFTTPRGIATALFFAISVFMMIWTGCLWAHGIRYAHHLPLWKGVVISVTMVLVSYLLILSPLLLFFGLVG